MGDLSTIRQHEPAGAVDSSASKPAAKYGIHNELHALWGPKPATGETINPSVKFNATGIPVENGANAIDTHRTVNAKNNWSIGVELQVKREPETPPPPPLSSSGQRNYAAELINLPLDKKVEIAAVAAKTFNESVAQQSREIGLGVVDGTERFAKGFVDFGCTVGTAAWNLAMVPQRMGEFGANLIVNPSKASADAAQFGTDVGGAIVTGARVIDGANKLCDASNRYIGAAFEGKAQPLQDLDALAHTLATKWDNLPLRERSAIATETLLSLVPIETAAVAVKSAVVAAKSRRLEEMEALCANIDKGLSKADAEMAQYKRSSSAEAELRLREHPDVDNGVRRARKQPGEHDGAERPREGDQVKRELAEAVHAAIERMVEVRGPVSAERQRAVKTALAHLPENDVLAVERSGYKVTVTNTLKAASDQFPAEFREGNAMKAFLLAHKDETLAITIHETKSIIIHTPQGYTGTINRTRHEFAHAMADLCGWEKNEELENLYQKIATRLSKRLHQLDALGEGGRNSKLQEEFEELNQIKKWIRSSDEEGFHETVADAYAIVHGGSRGGILDRILNEKFIKLIDVMDEQKWFRPLKEVTDNVSKG